MEKQTDPYLLQINTIVNSIKPQIKITPQTDETRKGRENFQPQGYET